MSAPRMPVSWASARYRMPTVCSRHGQPEIRRVTMTVETRSPWWTYLLIPFGWLPFLVVRLAMRHQVDVRAWPFCANCLKLRRTRLVFGWVALAATLACFVSALALGGRGLVADLFFLGFGVMLVVAPVLLGLSRYPELARASLSRDRLWVDVVRPAEAFATQVEGALAKPIEPVAVPS